MLTHRRYEYSGHTIQHSFATASLLNVGHGAVPAQQGIIGAREHRARARSGAGVARRELGRVLMLCIRVSDRFDPKKQCVLTRLAHSSRTAVGLQRPTNE